MIENIEDIFRHAKRSRGNLSMFRKYFDCNCTLLKPHCRTICIKMGIITADMMKTPTVVTELKYILDVRLLGKCLKWNNNWFTFQMNIWKQINQSKKGFMEDSLKWKMVSKLMIQAQFSTCNRQRSLEKRYISC